MRAGEFEEGERILRAKIDMASGNINMRDPALYRIKKVAHFRAGDKWSIYPMYDFAHPISDALEGITHSLCSLEYEDHRPLYDWVLDQLTLPSRPLQIEFGRLNLNYTVISKRKLLQLVNEGHVQGWDDPRMPTLTALRRRGYTPESIRNFVQGIGVGKRRNDIIVDVAMLEHSIRDHLNKTSMRVMGVLRPLRVVIENYPEGQVRNWMPSTIRKIPPPEPEKCRSLASSTSSRRISAKILPRSSSGYHPGVRYGCATRTS
jgi:glutaminyl-tRNA synthetase